MGYRIDYERSSGKIEVIPQRKSLLPWLTALCFVLFLLLCSGLWPEGMAFLRETAIPGDNAVTAQAAQNMVLALRGGAGLGEAVGVFCQEVIQSGTGLH